MVLTLRAAPPRTAVSFGVGPDPAKRVNSWRRHHHLATSACDADSMERVVDRRGFLGLAGAGAAGLALAACTSGSDAKDRISSKASTTTKTAAVPLPVPPAGGWATVDPTAVGWDPAALAAAFDYAGEHASRAMVAAVGGRVMAQQSWGVDLGFARDVASVQKSVTGLLIGNLADAGQVTLSEAVATYLGAGWTRTTPAQEAEITVRHLLTMTSGLTDDLRFEAAPGTRWRYNTNAYQELPHVVEAVTHQTMDAVTRAELFGPIGVSGASGWRDRPGLGRFATDGNGRRIQGLMMTAPDMARVGLLVARGGDWGGRRVLTDPRYLAAALNSSQDLNPSYGYLWWLNGKTAHVLPGPPVRRPGPIIPTAPADLVAALGKDDQKIYVCDSLDLVVTRIGANAGTRTFDALSGFDAELWRRLVAAAP
jgi:CubicO group peptidase (beta-lactamase class C family)